MRIDKIIKIDNAAQVFDNLKNSSAKRIYKLFEYIKETSEDFSFSASETFGIDEIEDFIAELNSFVKLSPFSETDQITQIIKKLLLYLRE